MSLIDFFIIKSAISMLPAYLNIFEIILLALWVVAIIAAGIISWLKLPHNKVKIKNATALVGVTVSSVFVISIASTSLHRILKIQ